MHRDHQRVFAQDYGDGLGVWPVVFCWKAITACATSCAIVDWGLFIGPLLFPPTANV